MREFGYRCTRCLKLPENRKGVVLPIMGCIVVICGPCGQELIESGVITPNTKGKAFKFSKKGGETK